MDSQQHDGASPYPGAPSPEEPPRLPYAPPASPLAGQDGATRRRPGPIPMSDMARTTIFVDQELLDWAKHRPGGLSEMVRRLLREERRRTEQRP